MHDHHHHPHPDHPHPGGPAEKRGGGSVLQGSSRWLGVLAAARGWLGAARRSPGKTASLLAALYLLSGVYYVPADQQAVRLRWNRLLPGTVSPGLHYAFPYPVERVIRLKMNEAQRLSIGGNDLSRTLGMSDRSAEEYLLTGDQNLVRVQAWIQYYIQDPGQYLFRSRDLPLLLECAFLRGMTRAVARTDVDQVLTTGRIALQNEVLEMLQKEVNHLGLGITVTTVALEEVSPPEEVREAFLEVANAREDRNRIVHEATGYANQLLPRVRGQSQEMVQKARIYHTELVNRALGEADRFLQLWEEYRKHRQVTASRLYLETMDDVLPRLRKVILDDQAGSEGLDLDILKLERRR